MDDRITRQEAFLAAGRHYNATLQAVQGTGRRGQGSVDEAYAKLQQVYSKLDSDDQFLVGELPSKPELEDMFGLQQANLDSSFNLAKLHAVAAYLHPK